MKTTLFRLLGWCVCLGLALAAVHPARAAQAGEAPERGALSAAALQGMLPMPTNAPVALFRQLLQMNAADRERVLASRSEASRAVLVRKLREYQALSPQDVESRLQALEFHHYLRLLLNAPASMRSAWLQQVPLPYRRVCEQRLQLWSVLPPEIRSYMQGRAETFQWLTRWESASGSQREQLMASLAPAQRQAMEHDFKEWTAMTPQQREQTWRSTRLLFEMSRSEQQRVLGMVSESQRASAARFVKHVDDIPRDQRGVYLDGCLKFAQLDPAQRARFLMGWERWKAMSEPEREVWRQLAVRVHRMPAPPVPDPGARARTKT